MSKKLKILSIFALVISVFFVKDLVLRGVNQKNSQADYLPAFPGAEGFGTDTVGGRGGQIIFVTNTNPSGAGSLKAAITAQGPRIVVFKTGGTINLTEDLYLENPYITIAGQTAPGDGITIKGAGLFIGTHDVIVRGLRFRVGDDPNGPLSTTRRGISLTSSYSGNDVYNVVVDHSSFSWGVDINMNLWTDKVRDSTFQFNVFSEALKCSIHIDEGDTEPKCHSMGAMLGSEGSAKISFHHNLMAHNDDRNPRSVTNLAEIVNNVVYNWGSGPTKLSSRGPATYINLIGNTYIPGQNTRTTEPKNRGIWVTGSVPYGSKIYVEGNIGPNRPDNTLDEWNAVYCEANCRKVLSPAFTSLLHNIQSAQESKQLVLDYAGARNPYLDSIDSRVLQDVINGTGQIIDSQDDVGGWVYMNPSVYPADQDNDGIPTEWENQHGLNPNDPNDAIMISDSGYMFIEEYVNSLIQMPPYVIIATPTPTVTPSNNTKTLVRRVGKGDDDAEQSTVDGKMYLNGSELEMSDGNSNQVVGLRFKNIDLPRNTEIVDAYIEFVAQRSTSTETTLYIRGEDTNNAQTFNSNDWNLSETARPRTENSVIWANIPTWAKNNTFSTPNITPIIREINSRSGWRSGNSLVILLKGHGLRVAKSYNSNIFKAPRLVIKYRTN